ncbi:MAG: uracil phosphoribosyltransferase [Eubacterium sp.]|nr:uracil phosphoribosyltransferase [Eubacterium sp.]
MERKVVVFDHPLIQHKLSILRSTETSTKDFRQLINEITVLMTYEATRDLPTENVKVETPCGIADCKQISGRKLAFVPILRAGLGMVDGCLELVPSARVGHIGLYRDESTHTPVEYYCKLPKDIESRDVFVVDPMLATGGSAIDAINQIKLRKPRKVVFMCIIAAPEGLEALKEAHPDVDIFCAALDEKLNDDCYIIPGLGDAGDRIFGTK